MLRKVVLVLVLFTALGYATIALADGGLKHVVVEDIGLLPAFNDGRLNAFDIDAPAAVFALREPSPMLDENGQQVWNQDMLVYEDHLVRIEVWGYLPGTESIDKVIEITAENLTAAVTSNSTYTSSENGYILTFDPASNLFVLSVPGYNYTYSWIMAVQ